MSQHDSKKRDEPVSHEEIVALLASEGGSQKAIGKLLGQSQSMISRGGAMKPKAGTHLICEVRLWLI